MIISSVDAINMYPLIKLSTIIKAVKLFSRKLTAATKKTIILCLELINFGMISTLITLDGKYYKYRGGRRDKQGLALGGYELAFLAELVASYLCEKAKTNFRPTTYHEIYIDDSLVVFKVKNNTR